MRATLLNRIKEPSTWAGLSVLLGVFGIHIAPEILTPIIQAVTGLAGVAAVLIPEAKK